MVDCKIYIDIGNFRTEDIISLMNSIHNDFIKEILYTSSVLISKGIRHIRISDIDNYLSDINTDREEIKDQFLHYINFDDDQTLIYSALNILNTEDSINIDEQIQHDTQLILGNKTLKNLCKFIIQYLFKVDLQITISSTCDENIQNCKGWFDYENCPLYAYTLTVIIIFLILFFFTMCIE